MQDKRYGKLLAESGEPVQIEPKTWKAKITRTMQNTIASRLRDPVSCEWS